MMPRPALPGLLTPAGTLAKHDWLTHCVIVCGAFALGSAQTRSGRAPAELAPRNPSPPGSTPEFVGVNGNPLLIWTIPDASQPPSTLPVRPFCARKNGSS